MFGHKFPVTMKGTMTDVQPLPEKKDYTKEDTVKTPNLTEGNNCGCILKSCVMPYRYNEIYLQDLVAPIKLLKFKFYLEVRRLFEVFVRITSGTFQFI